MRDTNIPTAAELKFKRGRTFTFTFTFTPEIVEKIYNMVLADRRIKVGKIEEAVGITYERVVRILHNELGFKKAFCNMDVAFAQFGAKAHFRLEPQSIFWKCLR